MVIMRVCFRLRIYFHHSHKGIYVDNRNTASGIGLVSAVLRKSGVSGAFLEILNGFVGIAETGGERGWVYVRDSGRLRSGQGW